MKLDDINVMLDIETLGVRSDAVIISIGAVVFTPTGLSEDTFYMPVGAQSCVDAGLKIDVSTVVWWMQRSRAARAVFAGQGEGVMPLDFVLKRFASWLPGDARVWGNGAGFDNVILGNAYAAAVMSRPWPYTADRCFRTVRALSPHVEADPFEGTPHHALDDAKHQARHLLKIAASW